jgi:hypothetical protein
MLLLAPAAARADEPEVEPAKLLEIGAARLAAGKPRAAAEAYRAALARSDRLTPQQVGAAHEGLTRASRGAARLRLEIDGLRDGDVVRIDGEAVSGVGNEAEVDPGDHVVAALREGREVARAEARAVAGQTSVVRLRVQEQAPAQGGLSLVAIGVGVLGAGAVATGIVLDVSAAKSEGGSATTQALVGNVAIGAGVAALAGAAYFIFFDRRPASARRAPSALFSF